MKSKKIKEMLNRYTVLAVVMCLLFGALGVRLYYLQVISGDYYSNTANTKTHKLISVEAPRGNITDKNGVKLATDVQSYNLTFTDTDNSDKTLFPTLKKVFQILDENGETQTDALELKTDPYSFQFSTSDDSVKQTLQLRFLKDRGFQTAILKEKKYNGTKESELSKAQTAELNEELLKLTPEDVYNTLIKNYKILDGLKSINVSATSTNIRRYLLVKDAIKMNSFSGYKAVVIASNINKNTSLTVQQELTGLPGIDVENAPMRQYPYNNLASSVLGYMGSINTDNEEKYEEKGYDVSNDTIGQSGIEAAMESYLRGNSGGEVVQVDKQGRITNTLATRNAEPGDNVQLTIDSNVQYATDQALQNEMKYLQSVGTIGTDQKTTNANRGAAVVLDVHTGGVLAMASLPSFNPNDFANPQGLTTEQNQKYFNTDYESRGQAMHLTQAEIDQRFPIDTSVAGNTTQRKDLYDFFPKPLYNYATMSLIPSGSTFKPVTGIAGLQTGVITSGTTYTDIGEFDIGGGHMDQFKSDGPLGTLDIVGAIARSSNPFFMNVAEKLRAKYGDDELAKYAWQFGLGADPTSSDNSAASTGIEIPESFGQVYNTYSQKNLSATQYLLNIEQDLTNGVSSTGTKLPVIDLADRSTDSKAVTSIKKEIKNDIKDTVINGTYSADNYKNLLKKLVSADSKYSTMNISDSQINAVVEEIREQALQTGHGSLGLPYNIYMAAIGQGMDNFTPLQMANYIATVGNGGTRYKVHLVDNITDSNGKVIMKNNPTAVSKADISESTRQLIIQGMEKVTGQGGTDGTAAATFVGFPIQTAGKTGTAEFNMNIQDKVGRSDYAWYIGLAPADNPQIAVAVVIFDGGYGSEASKVAKGIYEGYFKDELQQKDHWNNFDIDVNTKAEN